MTVVALSPRARQQVRDIETWWSEHRSGAAAGVFAKELAAALERLAVSPMSGPAYPRMPDKPDARCMLLRRSKYRIYYRIDAKRDVVRILAVWHMARGSEPNLR